MNEITRYPSKLTPAELDLCKRHSNWRVHLDGED